MYLSDYTYTYDDAFTNVSNNNTSGIATFSTALYTDDYITAPASLRVNFSFGGGSGDQAKLVDGDYEGKMLPAWAADASVAYWVNDAVVSNAQCQYTLRSIKDGDGTMARAFPETNEATGTNGWTLYCSRLDAFTAYGSGEDASDWTPSSGLTLYEYASFGNWEHPSYTTEQSLLVDAVHIIKDTNWSDLTESYGTFRFATLQTNGDGLSDATNYYLNVTNANTLVRVGGASNGAFEANYLPEGTYTAYLTQKEIQRQDGSIETNDDPAYLYYTTDASNMYHRYYYLSGLSPMTVTITSNALIASNTVYPVKSPLLTIPEVAIPFAMKPLFVVTPLEESALPAPITEGTFVHGFTITPSNHTGAFSLPVTLSMYYTNESEAASYKILAYQNASWQYIGGEVASDTKTIDANLSQIFGTYVLVNTNGGTYPTQTAGKATSHVALVNADGTYTVTFNPITLDTSEFVTCTIANVDGTVVRTLGREYMSGTVSFMWDGKTRSGTLAPIGVYIYSITVGGRGVSTGVVLLAQ